MASLLTAEFEAYIARQVVAGNAVTLDEFIFANIPDLTADNLADFAKIPDAAQIVHRQEVSQSGYISENKVAYSITLGSEVGDFDFNFVGLINKAEGLLAAAVQTDTIKKTRNQGTTQGNNLTRNILLEFSNAKALTGISVDGSTWQIDFSARLLGLDEKIRLTNRDLYGRAVFFDDGFLVTRKKGKELTINAGEAYVEGVRLSLAEQTTITANMFPCSIYVEGVHYCTTTGAYTTEIKFSQNSKDDYTDTANHRHYVQILADIDSAGNVTDRRLLSPFLGITPLDLDEDSQSQKSTNGHSHKLPFASLLKRGIAKLYSGTDSDSEEMAATPKAIKALKALFDSLSTKLKSTDEKADNRVPFKGDTKAYAQVLANSDGYGGYEIANGKDGAVFRFESEREHFKFYSKFGDTGYNLVAPTKKNGTIAIESEVIPRKGNTDVNGRLTFSNNESWITLKSTNNQSAAVDFVVQNAAHPQVSFKAVDIGSYGVEARVLVTPKGNNYNSDRREHVATFSHDGNLWLKGLGWLDQVFLKRSDCIRTWYPNHYAGTEVYKIRHLNLMITLLTTHATGNRELNLPEAYSGHAIALAIDRGTGNNPVHRAYMVGNNKVNIGGNNDTSLSVLVIGYKSV